MIELKNICKSFSVSGKKKEVIRDASIEIREGEMTGLIGPSGCGKTTLSRIAMKLIPPDSGRIVIDGQDVTDMGKREFLPFRKNLQMVFQNPYASLNPMRTMRWSLDEVFRPRWSASPDYTELCRRYEIPVDILDRRPIMVSGGEMQRISIMRSTAFNSKYLILDEPTSMLDVSTQASIMQIFREMTEANPEHGQLLITHDLDLAKACCSRLYLMAEGEIIESGKTEEILENPQTDFGRQYVQAYTQYWSLSENPENGISETPQ